MKVELIASTKMYAVPEGIAGTPFAGRPRAESDPDYLAELSGRLCYESWAMPNPATATNNGYMKNIISQGHFSVLEHASATFYITGVSRALTHELIRHRHLSYSELSQRFVDVEDAETVYPPALAGVDEERGMVGDAMSASKEIYSALVESLQDRGLPRKQAREAARAVMPNATETRIVVTGNMRAWRDFLHKRYSVHADAEIQALATEILKQLRTVSPAAFQDFPEVPFS